MPGGELEELSLGLAVQSIAAYVERRAEWMGVATRGS